MANITPTPTEVRPLGGSRTRTLVAGEALDVGMVVQIVGDGDVEMANATTVAGASGVIGMVVSGSKYDKDGDIAAGETVTVLIDGPVFLGSAIALDETKLYYVATTDGLITDVAPTNFRAVGFPISATILNFQPVSVSAGS